MNTSHLREQLAHQVAGEVLDGADPAAAAETAGFNTSSHPPARSRGRPRARRRTSPLPSAHARDAGLKVTVQATGHGAAAPAEGTVFVSTKAMQGRTRGPGHSGRPGGGRSPVATGDRRRRPRTAWPRCPGRRRAWASSATRSGGGMGHLARRHGFAADRVRAIELVTAAGEVTTVTAQSDPDLFWALRGGQGSFGIVTALEFDLVPVPRFYGGALFFTGADIEPVLRAFGAWAPTLPEEVTTSVALLRLPPSDDVPPPLRGTVSLALRFGFAGAPAEGAALLAPMRAVATPVLDSIGPMSYAEVDRIHMDPDGADARGHPRDAAHRPARPTSSTRSSPSRGRASTSRWRWSSCG